MNLQENIQRIKQVMGLLVEQANKTVTIQGKQPVVNADWDLVHGILGSKRLSEDLERKVGTELKNGNYRVTDVTVTSKKVGNEIITDGSVALVPVTGNELPHKAFTTRGSIGSNYESRHDTQVSGLPDRLKSYYGGEVTVFGPYIITVEGTNAKFKQSFFAVEGKSTTQQTTTQPQQTTTQTIEGSTLDEFRNNVKAKTGSISIDESSVNFSYTNNIFKVSFSTGETKIDGMTLVWDPNEDDLNYRVYTRIKQVYPNMIEKDEWKGKSGDYYYTFLILKK
jgi:hypothetical protein